MLQLIPVVFEPPSFKKLLLPLVPQFFAVQDHSVGVKDDGIYHKVFIDRIYMILFPWLNKSRRLKVGWSFHQIAGLFCSSKVI